MPNDPTVRVTTTTGAALSAGYDARTRGETEYANPWPRDTALGQAWHDGWENADEAMEASDG